MADAGAPHPCRRDDVTVHGYYRTKPRGKRKPKGDYWECVTPSGDRCGRHHTTEAASLHHARQLDKAVRRTGRKYKGRLDLYEAEKQT